MGVGSTLNPANRTGATLDNASLRVQLGTKDNTMQTSSNYSALFTSSETAVELDTTKAADLTLNLGGLVLRQWGLNVQIAKDAVNTGKEQVTLSKPGAILGFFNGLFQVA